ncbi:hypothetical protein F8O07_08605 [Pseudoclavibacter sp. CFCC 13796]|uniref:hypothetical protein n=1 Tax=Pseudoclavibacter sp. CFCC 13796 TaxID=2615179 RepID=UPI00130118C7|nr:hypothetical protein [Pseudoclavibacter sp. CFCC 13796]KAB1661926.1 hypothetical protein F8O07_08605 [Pseudoclavibacter sp. CFCC 13796]
MTTPYEQEMLDKMDLLLGAVQLAYAEEIKTARADLRSDPVIAAILDTCEDWTASATVINEAVRVSESGKRTVQRRIADLIGKRALMSRGAGASMSYKSTGLL